LRRSIIRKLPARVLCAVIVLLVLSPSAFTQQTTAATERVKAPENENQAAKPAATKPTFTLKVKREPILNISLKAEKAKLSEIADSLTKQLKTPVMVAAALEQHVVSMEFDELTLEPAMQLLAPEVYIDYEIKTSQVEQPRALGVFLYPANQGEPPPTAVVSGGTQSLLIEGDTEEGVEPATDEDRRRLEEKPLRIQFKDNLISIKAKKQSLALILLKVGEELGIPVDIQNDSTGLVDTDINKASVEEAMRQLSPNIIVFLRADLLNAERRALKLVLALAETPRPVGTKVPTP
jgi:hypothetical protein